MLKNDFIFGLESKDFKKNYVQSKFTEKLQKTFFTYTGKKIGVNFKRASRSTYNDTIPMILAETYSTTNGAFVVHPYAIL
jgi:hypothetical protein